MLSSCSSLRQYIIEERTRLRIEARLEIHSTMQRITHYVADFRLSEARSQSNLWSSEQKNRSCV